MRLVLQCSTINRVKGKEDLFKNLLLEKINLEFITDIADIGKNLIALQLKVGSTFTEEELSKIEKTIKEVVTQWNAV